MAMTLTMLLLQKKILAKSIDGNLDIVVANRVQTNKTNYRTGHIFGNWLINKIVKLFFGTTTVDMLSGYRVLSRKFVKSFAILSNSFEIETEMTIFALSLKLPIGSMDTKYFSRPKGSTSKLNTYKDGILILMHILRLFKDFRPLLLTFWVTILNLLLAVAFGFPVLVEYFDTGLVPKIPTYLTSLIFLVFSFLTLMTGLILDSIARLNLRANQIAFLSTTK